MIVMKMAAKSLATSTIGPQWNVLCSRTARGVMASETSASAIKRPSRTSACSANRRAEDVNSMPGFHMPDISTAPTIACQQQQVDRRPRCETDRA